MKTILIIGGNAAGMSAASQIKRQQPEWDVTVFEKGEYISYAGCGIPYHIQGLVPKLEALIAVTPEEAVEKRKINLLLKHEVISIDPEEKCVTVKNENTADKKFAFDYLLIATGASPIKDVIKHPPSERIYTVHTLNDSVSMRNLVDSGEMKKCAVIGGGYIALEMLEALKDRGLETHLFHRRDSLSRSFEEEISEIAIEEMKKESIVLHLNNPVTEITRDNDSLIIGANGEKLSFDLAVIGVGVEPNSALAAACGIQTGLKNSIRVNEFMQTNYPYIYAAGDCAETKNIITGKPVYIPLGLKANKEGVAAGVNISGGEEKFPGILGTAITKFFNMGLARTGLTLEEAEKNGFSAKKFSIKAGSKSHYYPGAGALNIVLIYENNSGRLLGAQLAGQLDAVKRIDVYAAAITAGMNLDDIFQLDLAYAPPFSPVYDPVVLSGRVGRKKV